MDGRRCATVMRDALPPAVPGAGVKELTEVLLASLRFPPYPEVPGVLRALRAGGARLVVVSNWDVSLHEVLERSGLSPLVDGAVTSAELGVAKPDPRIFERALALAGTRPDEAWHVGDSVDADVEGARRAGVEPMLVVRDGAPAPADVRVARDLADVVDTYSSCTRA
jgi:putative hydrolase of the HAD superfamily